ncbi:hypothetical protein HQ531_05705 [bacterium]|nr:hypothetical protein [bacterium]
MFARLFKKDAIKAGGIFLLILIALFSSVFFKGYVFGGGDTTSARGVTHQLNIYMSETGEYPLWQPYIFSGMPAFSSMMFTKWVYFPNFILGFLNKLGVPGLWTMLFHYLLAAMGVYSLLRYLKLNFMASLLGGLSYMLMPFFVVMISAGHGSQMMTAAYLPWLLYALKRIFEKPDLTGMLILALVSGLQFQRGHVQIAYYGWMAGGWFVMIEIFFRIKSGDWKNFHIAASYMLGGMLLGIGLAAVLYIPSLSYAAYTIRGGSAGGGLDYGYATSWSFPPYEVLALFFSDWFGFGGQTYWGGKPFTEHSDYIGLGLLILIISAFFNKELLKEKIFLLSTIILALLVSFGNYWPYLYDILFKILPFFNKFRVPSMILILLELMVALLAGIGLYTLLNLSESKKKSLEKKVLIATAVMGGLFIIVLLFKGTFTIFYASALAASEKAHPSLSNARLDMFYSSLIKSLFIVTASLALIWVYFSNKIKGFILALGMTGIVLLDLGHVDLRFANKAVSDARVKAAEQETPAIRKLKELTEANPGRIFPVHSFFGSNVWAMYGLESIGGYSPAKLKILQDFLNSTQLEQTFLPKYYSQTATGAAPKAIDQVDPILRKRHLDVLRNLNVKYLVSPYPLNDPLFVLVDQSSHISRGQRAQALIYEFSDDYPRAWFVTDVSKYASSEEVSTNMSRSEASPQVQAHVLDSKGTLSSASYGSGSVALINRSLQSMTLQTENEDEGFLVVSEVFYPGGWNAYLDGESVSEIYLTNELIRGMVIPAGKHEINFRYEPASVKIGFWITILSVLIVLGLSAFIIYRNRMSSIPD